jgi:hypothetical protein
LQLLLNLPYLSRLLRNLRTKISLLLKRFLGYPTILWLLLAIVLFARDLVISRVFAWSRIPTTLTLKRERNIAGVTIILIRIVRLIILLTRSPRKKGLIAARSPLLLSL